ncbi:MAG: ATP-binding protein [Elusimicrobiales bacterium]
MLDETTRRQADSLEMLVTTGRLLSSKLELGDLLNDIIRIAARLAGAERASLYLLDEKAGELYFDIALGLPPQVQAMRLKLGEGYAGLCAQQEKTILANDAASDSRHSGKVDEKSGFVTRSTLSAPMIMKGRVIGVLQAVNHADGPFTDRDVRAFEALASQAAVAIENARLFSSLREEKRRLHIVFATTSEGAIMTDPAGRVLLANDAARQYFPQRDEALGVKDIFSGMTMKPPLEIALSAPGNVVTFEMERQSPKKLFLEGSAIRLVSHGEKDAKFCEGWLWLFRDVTARRTEQLLARNFLSLVSHKLRTPLSVITGYSQTMAEEMPEGSPPFLKKSADTINMQGRKLAVLVDQILNFVAIDDMDAASLSKTAIAPAELLEEAAVFFSRDCAAAGVNFETKDPLPAPRVMFSLSCQKGLPQIQGDGRLLRKAVECLLDNARKFNPAPDKHVKLSARAEESRLLIEVEDDGAGIPPEEQAKIFDKFYQVESSFSGQVEGWGIGLAFVKKTAEAHGGAVSVKSEPGKGAVFTLSLPL